MDEDFRFRFRLNCVDHYQAVPTELDPQLHHRAGLSQQKGAPSVPVIRVFGATETGQKVCAHIHGALPYLYLEYDGSLAENDGIVLQHSYTRIGRINEASVDSYIHNLRISIDRALAVSYRRNTYDGKSAFVGHITLVKGVPFYGYNVGYKFYLKMYMLNPLHMTRLADLLYQGAIMNRVFQPYESHLQYLLQWMCDYNLYGCAYIDCARVKFRTPVPDFLEIENPSHRWHDQTIQPGWVADPELFPRQSHCSIEIDVRVQDILNRRDIQPRPLHHDFVERFSHLGPEEKYVHSMAGLWRDEARRRKKRMGITDPSSSPFPPEVLVSMSADPRNTEKGGWLHEEEYRGILDKLVQEERDRYDTTKLEFNTFNEPTGPEDFVKTALESVEDLFAENLQKSYAVHDPSLESGNMVEAEAENNIQEDNLREVTRDAYDSDGETARDIPLTQNELEVQHTEEPKPNNGRAVLGLDEKIQTGGLNSAERHCNREDLSLLVDSGAASEDHPDRILDLFGSFDEHALDDFVNQEFGDGTDGQHEDSAGGDRPTKRTKFSHGGSLSYLSDGGESRFVGGDNARTEKLHASKRVVFSDGTDSNTKPFPVMDGPKPQNTRTSGSSAPNQSSQGSIKASGIRGPNTLSFPTVKNPHDPDTLLRLSQRSGWSNSQKAPRTPAKAMHRPHGGAADSPQTPWSNRKIVSTAISPGLPLGSVEARKVAAQLAAVLEPKREHTYLCFAQLPPSADVVTSTMLEFGLPPVIYPDAYYSDEKDVPDRPREYAGREFKLESNTIPYLPDFDPTGTNPASFGKKPGVVVDKAKEEILHSRRRRQCTLRCWQIAMPAPSMAEVDKWLLDEADQQVAVDTGEVDVDTVAQQLAKPAPLPELSQIDGPTQANKHGFKYSQKQEFTSVQHESQYMSIMSLEVHVNTRSNFVPNPAEDEIACVFWCLESDNAEANGSRSGILALSGEDGMARKIARHVTVEVEHEEDELDLLNHMVDIVRRFDPDILTGYEVHNSSWGYLIERARVKYEYNLCDELSRMKSQSHGRFGKETDLWGFTHTSTIRITGRHTINIWRAMRGELNLLQYTMENVVFHLLHKRIPHYSFADLTKWYKGSRPRDLAKTIDYFTSRVRLNLSILEANELISRTSEQSRLLGVDFFSVFSRGSQFKVESLMFRIAKPENFIVVSPSRKQVGQQNALECLPLVMEPQSAFYTSPVLVLDFQSLYPSVMIAYNYCYSTCLGRIVSWRGQNKMGFTDFKREPGLLELVKEYINIAPNGIMYVKPEMRKSLIAKMLGEILETRVMVKSGMKVDKEDKTLQRLLNNRQLALKLIANVTYGYTSASFSGRMPCSEIADSIVQTGRETLERAITLIHSVERWGAEVVYGDTDSLFVHLKGRTKDEAFAIGNEIAEAVTSTNPRPVKLKFEKVYFPCVLLAKKRYVGFKYESPQQTEPELDAKGIETVRRDGTPAEQKIEEKALKILFRTADLSQVKSYFQRQCTKIMMGRVSIQDFLFAKEVKLGTYSDKGPPPPGALVATKRMLDDPRAEPQYGERVPYVVVTGAPSARLVDRCVAPETLLQDDQYELDAEYYISKNIIPPLERIFNLVGANVRQWYDEMPKVQRIRTISAVPRGLQPVGGAGNALVGPAMKTLENYLKSSSCSICKAKLAAALNSADVALEPRLPLCESCAARPVASLLALRTRLQRSEARAQRVDMVCRSCSGLAFGDEVRCDSRDCPVFYTRVRERANLTDSRVGIGSVTDALEGKELNKQPAFEW